jgi:5-methylcytosine-specific restriction endonuclease McrA
MIVYKPSSQKGIYCSNKCQAFERKKMQTEININLLLQGKLSDKNRQRIKKTLLALGIKKECSRCGISTWLEEKLTLILDHVDGNADNNSIENLRLLCSNCDSQTPNYKAKNKGKGRKNRIIGDKK